MRIGTAATITTIDGEILIEATARALAPAETEGGITDLKERVGLIVGTIEVEAIVQVVIVVQRAEETGAAARRAKEKIENMRIINHFPRTENTMLQPRYSPRTDDDLQERR